jgi:hypothetical protein
MPAGDELDQLRIAISEIPSALDDQSLDLVALSPQCLP